MRSVNELSKARAVDSVHRCVELGTFHASMSMCVGTARRRVISERRPLASACVAPVPQNTFDERAAPTYDADSQDMFAPGVLDPTVDLLAELTGDGVALELAIGTGRVALPLSRRGVGVHGIDISTHMVAEMRAKPGGDARPAPHHRPRPFGQVARGRRARP